jgi:hypothetical protein
MDISRANAQKNRGLGAFDPPQPPIFVRECGKKTNLQKGWSLQPQSHKKKQI